ncbi:hypothetical protein GJ688_00835 [Heliobacillus mobilis]|uniref:Uncharacterized protein n=1 Tax=Heliobacterium mobile TaxID=28064 RepID=A0A6I3SB82_HELMO|nr:hypothetical protein [Heliobacterium mobile]
MEQAQSLSILLGELSLRHGKFKDPRKFYCGGVANRSGSLSLSRQATTAYRM